MKIHKRRILLQNITIALFFISLLNFTRTANAQNISITDDDTYSAHSSAMLDVKSTTKGLLIPRMATTERLSIQSPATGLLVFDTDYNSFYYFNGVIWTNLAAAQSIWSSDGQSAFLQNAELNLGIGTSSPTGKFVVKGTNVDNPDEALFEVKNSSGETVFAVYPEGIRMYVKESTLARGSRGGFAVGGISPTRAEAEEYMRIEPGTARFYVEPESETKRGSRGGFAVGGISPTRASSTVNDYFTVSPDQVRVFIEEGDQTTRGSRGGFAVGGISPTRTEPNYYMNISGSSTPDIIPGEARMLWYPRKEAFLVGRILVDSAGGVGLNSMATGKHSRASGNYSQAMGYECIADGDFSSALGHQAQAYGFYSLAAGDNAKTYGSDCIALGWNASAISPGSLAVGVSATAEGSESLAFGRGSYTSEFAERGFALGIDAASLGEGCFAIGNQCSSGGDPMQTKRGEYSHNSFAIGFSALSEGTGSYAIGTSAWASGENSFALGFEASAQGLGSFAFGDHSYALGVGSYAIGDFCYAGGETGDQQFNPNCMAIGIGCGATGESSIAFGNYAWATGIRSMAIGIDATADGDNSIAIGTMGNEATGAFSMTLGSFVSSNGYTGSFLYGDYSTSMDMDTLYATNDNQFKVRAEGGFVFHADSQLAPENSIFIQPFTGNLGIGVQEPERSVHIKDVMRLEPLYEPPANPMEGDMYYDGNIKKLRVFDGEAWHDCW